MTVFTSPLTMHSCVYVFIPKEGDVERLVLRAIHPFSQDLQLPAYKSYLDAGEVKAMARHYRLKPTDLSALATRMKDWKGCPGGVDGRRFFARTTWNPNGKFDWYEIGGRWNGRLRGNVTGARTLLGTPNLRRLLPFAVVTPDGRWHEWETLIVEGWMKWHVERKTDAAWLKEVRTALRRHPGYRVACVDVHS